MKDLGITKQEASEAVFVHTLPAEVKEQFFSGEITRREAHRRAKRAEAQQKVGQADALAGKFTLLFALL